MCAGTSSKISGSPVGLQIDIEDVFVILAASMSRTMSSDALLLKPSIFPDLVLLSSFVRFFFER